MNEKRGSNRQRGGASVQEGSSMKLFERFWSLELHWRAGHFFIQETH